MFTIYFTDKALKFVPLTYIAQPDELVVAQSEVTSAKVINFFETCNTIIVPTEDCNSALQAFAAQFVYIEAAGGVVENERGEALLIFRRNRWDLPKGHIDAGEDALTAAVREIAEETGVRGLKFVRQLSNTLHAYNVYGKWELKCTYWFEFRCDTTELTPQAEEDIECAKWCNKEQLKECMTNSYPTIREIVYEYEHRG